ncbi:MAG: 5'-nucleotidase C-terminal domain-containing protein [Actinomycetes bacterium]|jgi:2',3'-cyclic-nucleotide 2'-phosphodiesterase (5'-nucleotidase family)|nr:5'-nucleotidase C-terminal domain-containing protein [Actinomycetes bacterium]
MGKRNSAVRALIIALVCAAACVPATVQAAELRVLFTHDLHSNMLPWTRSVSGKTSTVASGSVAATESVGGYARLKTLIDDTRTDTTVLLDAGDWSMGSFFNGTFMTQAPDLRALAAMGYDATTFGNHEFDYKPEGLAAALDAAFLYEHPVIVASNMNGGSGTDADVLAAACEQYGVVSQLVLDKNGVKVGLLGLLGKQAQSFTGTLGTLQFSDQYEAAATAVTELQADGAEVVIALSHSGTVIGDPASADSEDVQLARKVSGIDIIVSAHSHTVLTEPLLVGTTAIVSCGCYGEYLGVLDWDSEAHRVVDYRLVDVDASVQEDAALAKFVAARQAEVQSEFLDPLGIQFDGVAAVSREDFDDLETVTTQFGEYGLTDLITDGYLHEVNTRAASNPATATVSVVAAGIVRGTILAGDVTESELYGISSLGMGADGTLGYPLVEFYVTGRELRALCDVDVSVYPLMPEAQLFFSGVRYSYNAHRLIFNKVVDVKVLDSDGQWRDVESDKLYRVICSLYLGQMTGLITDTTRGIVKILPRDASGAVMHDINDAILHDTEGAELKEWQALSHYVNSFPVVAETGQRMIPESYYAGRDQRIELATNPLTLFENPNGFAVLVAVIIVAFVVVVVGVVLLIRRARRHRRDFDALTGVPSRQRLILPKL